MSLCFIALGKYFLHDAVETLSEPIETFTIHSTLRQGDHTTNPFIPNKEINRSVTFCLSQNTEKNPPHFACCHLQVSSILALEETLALY